MKHIIRKRACLLLLFAALGAGCGGDLEEMGAASPQTALAGMLARAEAGDWKGYVTTYYGERHKMKRPQGQTRAIAAHLESVAPDLIETLRACVGVEPVLSENGTVATWPNGFRLHKDGGTWGFHL